MTNVGQIMRYARDILLGNENRPEGIPPVEIPDFDIVGASQDRLITPDSLDDFFRMDAFTGDEMTWPTATAPEAEPLVEIVHEVPPTYPQPSEVVEGGIVFSADAVVDPLMTDTGSMSDFAVRAEPGGPLQLHGALDSYSLPLNQEDWTDISPHEISGETYHINQGDN